MAVTSFRPKLIVICSLFVALAVISTANMSVAKPRYSYNLYGVPGLIDMPTAQSAEDAEISATISAFQGQTRTTLSFQITSRLSGSFRYSYMENHTSTGEETWDRSFDFRYRILDEGRYRPAVAIGLQDFMGTGLYSAEYIVATKTFGDHLTVTGGIGWGRLGTYNGFSNPLNALGSSFDSRIGFSGLGGEPNNKSWFHGDAAFFGGVAWNVNDRLTVKAEYSSDAYLTESSSGLAADRFKHRSPLNFGLEYRIRPGMTLSAAYLYGSVVSVGLNMSLNPKHKPSGGGHDSAPAPVKIRPSRHISPKDWGTGWTSSPAHKTQIRTTLAKVLAADNMELEAFELTGNKAHIRIRNKHYDALPQAIGRTARILTHIMPASVEIFQIEPVIHGMAPSSVTLQRTDIENLENVSDGALTSFARAKIKPIDLSVKMEPEQGLYPRLNWGLAPFLEASFFDPDSPIRLHAGIELSGRYDIAPGFSVSGLIQQPLIGKLASDRVSDSILPHVRSDANIYSKADGPLIKRLTFDYYFQPGKNLYGHVSAGYLERMYGGISGELLWKPIDSRLGLGLELNYVKKRDFDQQFGFQDYDTVTGHASAYYEFNNGFHGQIDVGKYLAGDWGGTITVNREFKNGWKVGVFATFTNVSFSDFGEGSFDKGIVLTIPVSWALGRPAQQTQTTVIRPLTRDGGARLEVEGRLYDVVRGFQNPALKNRWGRFWK